MQRVANLILNREQKIHRIKIPGQFRITAGYRESECGAFGIIVLSLYRHRAAEGNGKGHILQQPQLIALR